MNITPFGRQIFFTPNKEESIIQTTVDHFTDTGVVTAVGIDVQQINVGDYIAFNAYGAQQVEINGNIFHFVKESDDVILCTYRE